METVTRVSAFQNAHNFSKVIAEATKHVSENNEPIESE